MDYEHRDRVIRTYLEGRTWDEHPEFLLIRTLVLKLPEALQRWPYLVEYEWEVSAGWSQAGKGDLVFGDGEGSFAIVEVKWIDNDTTGSTSRTRRTKKRKAVREQAQKYAVAWWYSHPEAVEVRAFTFTDDHSPQGQLDESPLPSLSRDDLSLVDEDEE